MIASLPMYDRPSNAAAHDRLWALIRDNLRSDGISAPDALDRAVLYRETWGRSDLVVGQICVMPYAALDLSLAEPLITGGHDASVIAVTNGTADFASIDAQTWAMQQREMPETARLRIVTNTPVAPGQSFITRQSTDPTPYFAAIKAAIADLPKADKTTLGLRDIVALPPRAYA